MWTRRRRYTSGGLKHGDINTRLNPKLDPTIVVFFPLSSGGSYTSVANWKHWGCCCKLSKSSAPAPTKTKETDCFNKGRRYWAVFSCRKGHLNFSIPSAAPLRLLMPSGEKQVNTNRTWNHEDTCHMDELHHLLFGPQPFQRSTQGCRGINTTHQGKGSSLNITSCSISPEPSPPCRSSSDWTHILLRLSLAGTWKHKSVTFISSHSVFVLWLHLISCIWADRWGGGGYQMTNKPVNNTDLVCGQHTAPGDACATLYGLCLTLWLTGSLEITWLLPNLLIGPELRLIKTK